MKVEIEIPDSFLYMVMNRAGYSVSDLTEEQISDIKEKIAEVTLASWKDEPHYFYDDYIQDILPYKE